MSFLNTYFLVNNSPQCKPTLYKYHKFSFSQIGVFHNFQCMCMICWVELQWYPLWTKDLIAHGQFQNCLTEWVLNSYELISGSRGRRCDCFNGLNMTAFPWDWVVMNTNKLIPMWLDSFFCTDSLHHTYDISDLPDYGRCGFTYKQLRVISWKPWTNGGE